VLTGYGAGEKGQGWSQLEWPCSACMSRPRIWRRAVDLILGPTRPLSHMGKYDATFEGCCWQRWAGPHLYAKLTDAANCTLAIGIGNCRKVSTQYRRPPRRDYGRRACWHLELQTANDAENGAGEMAGIRPYACTGFSGDSHRAGSAVTSARIPLPGWKMRF